MNLNPYEPPSTATNDRSLPDKNRIGRIGFFVSLTGAVALFAVPFGTLIGTVAACVAFVSLPGLIISCIGLFRHPRRLAGWGVALGIFGSLYLPTLYLSLFHF